MKIKKGGMVQDNFKRNRLLRQDFVMTANDDCLQQSLTLVELMITDPNTPWTLYSLRRGDSQRELKDTKEEKSMLKK